MPSASTCRCTWILVRSSTSQRATLPSSTSEDLQGPVLTFSVRALRLREPRVGPESTRKHLSPKTRSSGLLDRPRAPNRCQAEHRPHHGGQSCRVSNGTTANLFRWMEKGVPGLGTELLSL